MPVVPINETAVVAAAAANFVLGFLWYGPLFGKQWMSLMQIPAEKIREAKAKGMGAMKMQFALAAIGSLIMSYVLAHALVFASSYFGVTGPSAGIMAGFWNWLGFIAPVTLGSVLWEGRPWALWVLNNAYWLLSLCVMGVILAVI